MKNNLILRYQKCEPFDYTKNGGTNELIESRRYHGWNDYFELKDFLKSIEGKVVDLIFTCGDAFEINNDNYWLPEDLWDEVIYEN